MRVTAFLCFALACVMPTSTHAFSYSKGFDGGSVRCASTTVRSVEPKQQSTHKGGGKAVVDVVDAKGEKHRYVIAVTARTVAARNIGAHSRSLPLTAWDFVCRVTTDKGAAHTCTNVHGTTGSCLVCSDGSCKSVTFRVSRAKQ